MSTGVATSNQPKAFTAAGGESAGGTAAGVEFGSRYPGGKNAEGTWQWLLSQMPPHARYVEP